MDLDLVDPELVKQLRGKKPRLIKTKWEWLKKGLPRIPTGLLPGDDNKFDPEDKGDDDDGKNEELVDAAKESPTLAPVSYNSIHNDTDEKVEVWWQLLSGWPLSVTFDVQDLLPGRTTHARRWSVGYRHLVNVQRSNCATIHIKEEYSPHGADEHKVLVSIRLSVCQK
eukprot:gnl/MRDRNA2_/MRDRNA2_52334_c0_seq1.p1 gnl/MRDRNA2_/MRDRNA2_52334_c0~~gnl/MRDRNA2_/MRDRNA2_52334_c0_seq1.p1  ORF type:complete len:168 (+),score=36.18 gnl/MRDRNA2_/MRDRNA2_52334_c0_seq1:123-626(+)